MTLALFAALLCIGTVSGGSSALLSIYGGSISIKNASSDGLHNSADKRSNFDTSDDFYLETFPESAAPASKVDEGFVKSMLLNDDVFYDAVDYESASAISKSIGSVRNIVSTQRTQQPKSSFLKVFKVFAWKGFGLSFEKSVIQWNAFGAGIRVPVSSNFPEWDRNSALPKLSTTFGLNYPYGCKMSLSVSFPLGIAIYGLIILGKDFGIFSSSPQLITFLDKLKKPKATDSIKRIGITSTIRYTKDNGLQCYIGPWGFYYPGQMIMQHMLPMIFLFPAIIVTVIGFLIQYDTSSDSNDFHHNFNEINSNKNANTNSRSALGLSVEEINPFLSQKSNQTNSISPSGIISQSDSSNTTQINKTKSTMKNTKKKSNNEKNNNINNNNVQVTSAANIIKSSNNKISNNTTSLINNNNNNNMILNNERKEKKKTKKIHRPRGVRFYHDSILKWASTKTTGLGYNLGMRYKGIHDASIGSRVVFEIQSFYPFPKTMKKITFFCYLFPSSMSNYFKNIFRISSPRSNISLPVTQIATSTSSSTLNSEKNLPSVFSQLSSDSRRGPKSTSTSPEISNSFSPSSYNQKDPTKDPTQCYSIETQAQTQTRSQSQKNINSSNNQNKNFNSEVTTHRNRPDTASLSRTQTASFSRTQTASFSRTDNSKRPPTEILSTNSNDQKLKKKISNTSVTAQIPSTVEEKKK